MRERDGSKQGFTLLEILLVVALLGMLAALSAPVVYSYQSRNYRHLAADGIGQSLRRAQVLAQQGEQDTDWGVRVLTSSNTLVLFAGSSYAARDTSLDEFGTVPNSMTLSGLNEVVFEQVSGTPNTTGTISITAPNSQVSQVTINSIGVVDY